MKISEIIPYSKNAKKHPDKQLKLIAASLKEFGWQQPIVVDKKGVIIVGHGRYYAYKKYPQGIEEPPINIADLTKEQSLAYRLADNKLNESDWDMDLVIEDLLELSMPMIDLTGFDKDLLISEDELDNNIPDIPTIPKTKLGDLYEIGNHRVICGDSLSEKCLDILMGDQKAQMVFTDPPYNVNYESSMKDSMRGNKDKTIINDNFETTEDFYIFLKGAITQLKRFVVGDVYVCMSSSSLDVLQKAFRECGGHWSTFIIWVKNTFTLGRSNYQRQYEPILYGWFEGSSHYWSGRRNLGDVVIDKITTDVDGNKLIKIEDDGIQTDVWEFKKPSRNKLHPTMKPVELVNRSIMNSSRRGEIVMDIFLGGGSTVIACEKAQRACYGIELDPKFVDVIVERWCEFTGKREIIKNGKKILWG